MDAHRAEIDSGDFVIEVIYDYAGTLTVLGASHEPKVNRHWTCPN